jgi:Uma2 family endonuclease
MSFGTHLLTSDCPFSPYPGHRFTVEEYQRMGACGILTAEDRVELLEGWVVPKMIHNPVHDGTVAIIHEVLAKQLPEGWHIRVQSAITTADSQPEPDLVITRGRGRDFLQRHPGPADIALVIEVADTSLERDRDKRRIYARAGVGVYWLVNLRERRIEVYSEPTGEDPEPAFRRREDCDQASTVPLLVAGAVLARLAVSALLP